MTDRPVRRVGLVLAAYLVAAWVVLSVARWVSGVLVLPALFDTLLVVALVLGAPLSVVLAWVYPSLGHHGQTPRSGPHPRSEEAGG